jgi:hypothetical protein
MLQNKIQGATFHFSFFTLERMKKIPDVMKITECANWTFIINKK